MLAGPLFSEPMRIETVRTAGPDAHPERESPEVRRLRPNFETEATAMRVVMEYEAAHGRTVADVHEKNLGYDITSLDPKSGELRLIEIKGLRGARPDPAHAERAAHRRGPA